MEEEALSICVQYSDNIAYIDRGLVMSNLANLEGLKAKLVRLRIPLFKLYK